MRIRALVEDRFPAEGVERRRLDVPVAVGGQVVGSERVDADQEDVADRGARPATGEEEP